jgi:YidC/Oxa1 family membrane protein insertase
MALIFIGILPLMLGVSMWLQMRLNPAHRSDAGHDLQLDALGLHVHAGQLRLGLVIYWIANNVITFIQQYIIMWRHGHRPDLLGNIKQREAKTGGGEKDGEK